MNYRQYNIWKILILEYNLICYLETTKIITEKIFFSYHFIIVTDIKDPDQGIMFPAFLSATIIKYLQTGKAQFSFQPQR